MASGFGRIGAMVMPFFLLNAFFDNPFKTFRVIGLFSFIGVIAGLLMPFDTRNREIDTVEAENDEVFELPEVKKK